MSFISACLILAAAAVISARTVKKEENRKENKCIFHATPFYDWSLTGLKMILDTVKKKAQSHFLKLNSRYSQGYCIVFFPLLHSRATDLLSVVQYHFLYGLPATSSFAQINFSFVENLSSSGDGRSQDLKVMLTPTPTPTSAPTPTPPFSTHTCTHEFRVRCTRVWVGEL